MGVVSGKPNRIPDPSHIWESDFVPSGVMFNPKTSEISSHRFIGLDSENNLVFSPDRSIESVNQSLNEFDSSDFLENQFDNELAELSELNQYACEKFAKKHGPLFGTMYFENGICKEPLDMWLAASALVNLALNIKSAMDSGNWRVLDEKKLVAFNFERCVRANERGEYEVLVDANFRFPNGLPVDYAKLTLSNDFPKRIWSSKNFDPPGIVSKIWRPFPTPEIGIFDRTEQDRKETAYDSMPGLDVCIWINPTECELRLEDGGGFLEANSKVGLVRFAKG